VVPVERLSISRPPATTSFKQGDDFDPAGLSVLAEFADAAVPGETLGPERLTFSGYDRDKAGTQTINAEYYGKQASFEVKVAALSKIAVTSPPYNTEYFTGEDLDLTGLVVMGTWEGIGEKPLNVTIENISGFDTNRAGKQDVFVTYSGKTANFSVTYVSMQSISVSKAPAKLKYENGEELDLAGLAIQGTRMGATSIELVDNSRLKISGYDRFKAGEQTVTVTIGGRSAAFTVTVGPNLFVGTWYGAASNIPGQGGARPVILTMSEDSWSLTFTQLVNQAPPTTEYTGTYTRDSGRRATLLGAVGWAGDTVEILSYGQLKITGGVVFGEPGIILTR
jgi:hypothetical protein